MAVVLALSVLAVALVEHFRTASATDTEEMLTAATEMQQALAIVAADRVAFGPPLDPTHDVNMTGMIGGLFTPTTSTTGNLAAKRTTTNPDVAGLIVHLLRTAGVHEGDYVAVGGSGSFPALLVATLSAAKAMNLKVGLIVSLAASQWGANLAGFTWLDIEASLVQAGWLGPEFETAAASVGGSDDVGSELPAAGRTALRERIFSARVELTEASDLMANVATRMAIYAHRAAGRKIAAFINIGGSWANLGTSAEVLTMSPGVTRVDNLPPESRRGVVHAMAAAGVPVVHLLDIAKLASAYGLPWDPVPLPPPGRWHPEGAGALSWASAAASATYGVLIVAWLTLVWLRARRRARASRPRVFPQFP